MGIRENRAFVGIFWLWHIYHLAEFRIHDTIHINRIADGYRRDFIDVHDRWFPLGGIEIVVRGGGRGESLEMDREW